MQTIRKSNNLEIIHNQLKKKYVIRIDYTQILSRLNNLSRSNVFFTTYKEDFTVDGFVRLTDSFFVRILIVHKLGAIVKIKNGITNKKLLKLSIDTINKNLVVSVIQKGAPIGAETYYNEKFYINHPILNDFYIDISIATSEELIKNKWHENSTPNRAAQKKDHIESDDQRYKWSENSDGSRKKNELLAGNGSNIGPRSHKVKKKR